MSGLIVITDYVEAPFDIEQQALGNDYQLVSLETVKNRETVLANADAVLVWHEPITSAVVDQLRTCQIVVRYGVGFDAIDIGALEAKGIAFSNTPDYGTEEVADTAVAMILQGLRKISEYDDRCRHYVSGWQEHTLPTIKRSNQTTVGVVGVGRIGGAVIQRLKPFGFHIVGIDPDQPSGHEKSVGYERFHDLSEMLKICDAVSIHCPLKTDTQGLINTAFIRSLKPGCLLVNTARGGLIDTLDTLHDGLKTGQLGAIGLDVLPSEPPGDHPLIKAWRLREDWLSGRMVVTPHTAYFSDQAWSEMRHKTAETAKLFLETGQHRNPITVAGS